ncbi:TetR/AcrR family transcriptional regulator [Gilvimarinus polysaccharolyticus]|uniref:TetR/AcrR family transcriptional regulator n=1 Tax=Gilvimarinus polysaccharolyticus TaxID=863921 RepID=UPI000673BC7B|nr:TetR/AcrR family transcriptional regulator [Gilvimarinus polysaccharolyticus]
MARKTKADAQKTLDELLDAAAWLFHTQGVNQTTLNHIASRAGVTRGALYWHFANKDAVIMGLWERDAAATHANIVHKLQSTTGSGRDFKQLIKAQMGATLNNAALMQALRMILLGVERLENDSELQSFLAERHQQMRDSFKVAFKRLHAAGKVPAETSPEALATSFWAYLKGLLVLHLEPYNQDVNLLHDGNGLLDIWLNAIISD